ncbi:MAG TPA: nucleoside 2-deoxyribosyltransferase domain-containing protein [Cytophagales bacterium]|nr:nucleoside 2-deoxyribosyltransferase domain-containing protein [Cytophagales bacterium]
MSTFTPPINIAKRNFNHISIFLAGSIDMGNAINWQQVFIDEIRNTASLKDINVFNPRRPDWDSSWEQHIENPNFYQQVNWELNALDAADFIVVYFSETSLAPITLLELGLYAQSGKLLVCCPQGYWRKGNVDIVCHRYNIPMFDTLHDITTYLISMVGRSMCALGL